MRKNPLLTIGLIFLVLCAILAVIPEFVGKIANPTLVPETRETAYNAGSGETQWNITWYAITGSGDWKPLGQETWPSEFNRNWGDYGVMYDGLHDRIGFVANSVIYVNRTGSVEFTLGSDDGSILYVDSNVTINLYSGHTYEEDSATVNYLPKGFHDLTIRYFQNGGEAAVYFQCDQDVTAWELKTGGSREQTYYVFQVYYGRQTSYYGIAAVIGLVGLVLVVNGTSDKATESMKRGRSQMRKIFRPMPNQCCYRTEIGSQQLS